MLLCALTVTVACLASAGAAAAASTPHTALIDAESVTTFDEIEEEGSPISLEQYAAEHAGFTVTVASGAEWEKFSAEEFAKYQLLIVGDPICNTTAASAVNSAKTWVPVVMGTAGLGTKVGNRTVVGTDPEYHYLYGAGGATPKEAGNPSSAGAEHLVQDGIAFAGGVPEATGIYFDTSCADIEETEEPEEEEGEEEGESAARAASHAPSTGQGEIEGPDGRDKTEVLDKLTTTKEVWTENPSPPCGGNVAQIAANPVFDSGPTELTDEDIEGWQCSVHVAFPSFPADWNALAVATDTETKPTCGTDPDTKEEKCGQAYVLVAGEGIVAEAPNLTLEPKTHSDPTGGSHTVTATVTKEEKPVTGTVVTFTLTGQNAGVTGTCTTTKGAADPTCETDETGGVQFTYPDTNGAGTDTIGASVTLGETTEHATASEEWGSEVKPTSLATTLSGGGQSGGAITVKEGTPVTDSATLSGENASSATGSVSYAVYSDSGCTKLVKAAGSVTVSGEVVPVSEAETLSPGTYYWQASYTGDGRNAATTSTCAEVETVEKVGEVEGCTTVVGSARVVARHDGESEHQKVINKLSTNLAAKQKLVLSWENGANKLTLTKLSTATCTVGSKKKRFAGTGVATVNGTAGWNVKFYFTLGAKERYTFHIHMSKPKETPIGVTQHATKLSSETIS